LNEVATQLYEELEAFQVFGRKRLSH
jgi:hypothetical protein